MRQTDRETDRQRDRVQCLMPFHYKAGHILNKELNQHIKLQREREREFIYHQ